tara:strand:+ start:148 stop:1104 length:957 start_codon:yes stop_codon:yes gene_type:complete
MFDYQKAPYLELDTYKAPKGIKCIYIPMQDNYRIRLAYWKSIPPSTPSRGVVLLQQGHNEFIEKYFETIQELIDRNFDVISFDWRGQGLSDRMIDNKHKQYIEDFSIHDKDLEFILNKFIKVNFSGPLIAFGHSMGGCLVLSSLPRLHTEFNLVILSAPMLGFKNEMILNMVLNMANLLLPSKKYFPGSRPNMGLETPFEDNDLTSDYDRYTRTQKLVRIQPDIRLWGVTIAWVNAVNKRLKQMRKPKWAEEIKSEILIINSLKDRVVCSDKIYEMHKRLPNSQVVNFTNAGHEVLMENDKIRREFWINFDEFIDKLP